ncbi:MAG TPA: glycosyltransferase family 4 protein [Prolixibacteraceae bacterium]|jgi:glycosyltransferase involved in cell wall biosynthesis
MNIIQIIPGSGGSFYCGNCLRDSKFIVALREQGHQVIKIPMYLPIFADEHDIKEIPVFYGAVSIYLKQLYPIFRKSPLWVEGLLNSKPLLKMAASMAGSTNAKGLEEMTVSMLLGEDGKQQEELERLVDWMAEHCKPDVVHISNALLLGLAHRIKEKLNVPIVCSLQDEDVWVDAMQPAYREQIWKLMSEKAKDVDYFISVSNYFAKVMQQRMKLPPEKIRSLYLGVDPLDYEFIPADKKGRNIGYISRMCHENGFDIVVDAFIQLKYKDGFDDVKLILTGGSTGADSRYIKGIRKKLSREKLSNQVEFMEDFEDSNRKAFFSKVSVVTVPVRNGEAFGMYLLESMASGIPVVQPALGAFPEIVNLSGGGIIYQPNTSEALCEALVGLLSDPGKHNSLSVNARKGVEMDFNIHDHAKEMIDVYQKL